ncbi:polymorphic toxin type 27 domain-containing protein [Streptomyces sp. NPDC059454]|uniref:polymorphic toxin type 27 domain-containing protein n=1 Tax=Streptomyces sp. NPDC059454 TaxID=3346836 RepID=UPI0036AF76A4
MAVLTTLMHVTPAAADTVPEEDTGYWRNSIGEGRRLDRCLVGVALHFGGANVKTKAVELLSGTAEELHAAVNEPFWDAFGPIGLARDADSEAALDYRDRSDARTKALDAANEPYTESAWASDDMDEHAPEFDKDVREFTLFTQEKLAGRIGWEGHSNAGPKAIARAKEITEANRGKEIAHDWAADSMLREPDLNQTRFSGGTTASDIASYLRHGGFLTEAPAEGSAEYRVEVENLKQAWAACDYQNPVDPQRALNGPVMTAMAEWEVEYASQATPRATIIQAEADAAKATREATDDMIEAIGEAWRAEQILTWRKYWQEQLVVDPEDEDQPDQAFYDQADADLARVRTNVENLVASAEEHAATAATAAGKAATAQQEAWAIADTNHVPRGRGLMYAQQSVQVARASSAATEAAAKATRTALEAANATVADSDTLLAKAQTQSRAVNTEFRRIAAQEAAAQAKAAADSAEADAKAAEESATTAETARTTAQKKQGEARQAAADAQSQRAKAELEHATAVASRVEAASERAKAQEAEARAKTEQAAAENAKTEAGTAASEATGKRKVATEKANAAQAEREKAVAAERNKQATAARAAALKAAAAAAEGTEAADETRQAADEAQTAAEKAATAATAARTEADEATSAAVAARTAVTKAEGAAERAEANASSAWSAYLKSSGDAASARAATAKALDASQDAAFQAEMAATASENASELSKKAKAEAAAAVPDAEEAVKSSAVVVGRAYAAGQAALAARDSAKDAIAAANDAVSIGTPYQEKDSSAAFAVLVGQSSKTLAEQQAAAAEAKAAEAAQAADDARQAADQALGDAKAITEAAAQAAADSARASQAVIRAQEAAADAASASQAAGEAAGSATGFAEQAGTDAVSAGLTANKAGSEAVEADREATEAERGANRTGVAADEAADAAADAQEEATKAEQDAKDAEERAAAAEADSAAAEDAAQRAEQEKHEQNEAEREEALQNGSTPVEGGASNWPTLGEREEQILLDKCGQTCVDEYRAAIAAVSVNVVEWTASHGGQILFDELGTAAVKQCLAQNDVEGCLWSLVDVESAAVIVGRIPALAEAIEKVSTGIRQVFGDAGEAQWKLDELTRLISEVRSTPRRERCVAGVALHVGGAHMKAKAIEGLSGTNEELRAVVGEDGWISLGPLGQASDKDWDDTITYRDASYARTDALEEANSPYAASSFSDDIKVHAPRFDKDVLQFTLFTQKEMADRLGWDGHSYASAEAISRAREITDENRGKDPWYDYAADNMLRDAAVTQTGFPGGITSSDIAAYLKHGGFVVEAPVEGSAEFRIEVEDLKQAWSSCDHQDPVDPRNRLSAVVSQASAEWEAEYTAQAAPRAVIVQAEADAAAATRAATDNMVEAIGQAWLAEQILLWQKYWHDELKVDPNNIFKPKQSLFDRADVDLARARGKVQALTTTAKQQASVASAAATRAVTAQKQAYDIADANEVPRGRGLSYAQQSVQVARASGAAAQAAAKATETALNAANATVSEVKALLALAKTETHAVNTEFRRIAAQEAAAQAKAAADSADKQADEAEANAATAKAAQATAEKEEEEARKAAATAQSQRAIAELERANAAAHRATAEAERVKAGEAEARAQEQRSVAGDALSAAGAAGSTAAARRADAEEAERNAITARDKALEAEQKRDSLEAKAQALEAHAEAVAGTEAAEAARTAAEAARAAANKATTAATNARTAANEATTAATNAREAATKTQGAAARARSSADTAWAAYLTGVGAAANAHAAAAVAIDASETAAQNSKKAEADSKQASAAAATAKKDAAAAKSEAAETAKWAATTAGHAYATAVSAVAARDTATQTAASANQAIAIGAPYQQTDASAAFAVLTGQSALTLSEQQAAAAEARAAEAATMSTEAQRLAEQADGDAKLAMTAAAAAAQDAERAARAVKRAQSAAKAAAKAAQAAQSAADRASGYARQAGEDALYAGFAASEAETDAVAADREATEAEKDASSARAAADEAESDAADARDTADQAEKDAAAAEKAAAGAWDAANEAQEAADRTEKSGSGEQISQGVTTGISDVWAVLDHIEYIGEPQNVVKDNCNPILHFGDCTITSDVTYKSHVDVFMCMVPWESYTSSGRCPTAETVYLGREVSEKPETKTLSLTLTMDEFNSGIDPIDILLGDFIGCAKLITPGISGGSWGDCAWAASWFVAGVIFRTAKTTVMAMDAAIKTGVGFMDAFHALRTMGLTEAAVQGIIRRIFQRVGTACEVADTATFSVASYSATTFAAASSNDEIVKKCQAVLKDLVKDGDHIVLGVNAGKDRPGSNNLAPIVGGQTFNHSVYATELPESMGLGKRAIWTVGVERAVSNPNVKITVSLDGVQGAENADDALRLLLARGEAIPNSDWGLIQSAGYGTAWEMIKLRTAVRLGDRNWRSIEWRMYDPDTKTYKVVEPERFRYPNGELVPDE